MVEGSDESGIDKKYWSKAGVPPTWRSSNWASPPMELTEEVSTLDLHLSFSLSKHLCRCSS